MVSQLLLVVGFVLNDEPPVAAEPPHEMVCVSESAEVSSEDFDNIDRFEARERLIEEKSKNGPQCPRGPGYQGATACARAAQWYCQGRGSTAVKATWDIDYKLGGVETCRATCADGQVGVGRSGGDS